MKKTKLKNIIKESIKELMTEQQNYNCNDRKCSPFPPSLVNQHWWNFADSANNMQNANFADYRYEHTGNISYCQSDSGPGHQWRWFDGITLSQYEGPNPIHPNWASMVTYLQNQGVAVTLAMTGQQVNLAAIQTLQTSGIYVTPQGACGNQPCPPPCKDDPTDPCKKFATLPQAQQDGCCEKCQGNISPQDPCYQYCKCCDPDPTGDDPCKDNPDESCYWCFGETSQGGPCVPVGGNLQYALNNGFNLYSTQAACNAAEPGCRPDDIDPVDPKLIECHKCEMGYPVANMFPGPTCPQGWTPAAQFNPRDCKPGGPTDPSDTPVDMVDPGMDRMRELME